MVKTLREHKQWVHDPVTPTAALLFRYVRTHTFAHLHHPIVILQRISAISHCSFPLFQLKRSLLHLDTDFNTKAADSEFAQACVCALHVQSVTVKTRNTARCEN